MLDSIRAQTTVALAVGMVAVLVAGVVIAAWTVGRSEDGYRSGFEAAMVALAVAADELPEAARPALVHAAGQAGVILRLGAGEGNLVPDVYTDALGERLRRSLEAADIRLVAVGHQAATSGQPSRLWEHYGDIVVRLALSDGTVVELAEPSHWSMPGFLLQALPVVLTVGAGLVLLGIWVARRVTAPLERFAAAAERLGRDVNAPTLDETGPREIRRMASVLNRTQQRIRRLLDDRTQMLAAIAHDLRTPIMRLYLRAEMLPDPDQQAKMNNDLAEMDEMIGAALAFAREENRSPPRESVDLADLLGRLRDQLEESGQAVDLVAGDPVVLEGDPGALKRAFGNLIENAVRYGHRAEVRWRVLHDRIEVTVDDWGPGIPRAERERVFSPFYRLEPSRSRESGGAGLGMTVARSVVRGHGGEITLENRAQGGLRQTVILPRD